MSKEEFHYSEDRDDRVKDTAEVFTPNWLIQEMLESLNVDWDNPTQDRTFIDPTSGSGNFLVALAQRGIPLCNIYGVDLMPDNIETCKRRLTEFFLEKGMELGDEDTPDTIKYHLERNIVCEDALTYHYEFWWHKPEIYEQNQKEKIKLEKIRQEKQKAEEKRIEELKILENKTQSINNDEW